MAQSHTLALLTIATTLVLYGCSKQTENEKRKDRAAQVACATIQQVKPITSAVSWNGGDITSSHGLRVQRQGDEVICIFDTKTKLPKADVTIRTLTAAAFMSRFVSNPEYITGISNDEVAFSIPGGTEGLADTAECLFSGCYYNVPIDDDTSADDLAYNSALLGSAVAVGVQWESGRQDKAKRFDEFGLTATEFARMSEVVPMEFFSLGKRVPDARLLAIFEKTCVSLSIPKAQCLSKGNGAVEMTRFDYIQKRIFDLWRRQKDESASSAKRRSLGF